ncbi:MAG: monooxygenase [Euzebya sp.]
MTHVTVHLWRVHASRVPLAIARMGLDRQLLRGVDGLRFRKLLGTGDGRTFSPRDADLRTWGLLCAWDSRADSLSFEGHATPRGWRRIASQEWRADLATLRTKGRWSGRQPFTVRDDLADWDGPVAAITRARLKPSLTPTFWRAVPPVVADLDTHDGLEARVGIGEAPLGLQGTLTVWQDAAALTRFAYRHPAHRQAITDTGRLGWYAEELFARFAVLQTRGTLFGDPTVGLTGVNGA